MSTTDAVENEEVVMSGFFGVGKSRSAAELAASVPAVRQAKASNSRSRVETSKTDRKARKARAKPMAPTPERLAKGDIEIRVGMHRAIAPIERLRDMGKLAPKPIDEQAKKGSLSYCPRENAALYEAALKLRKHFDGCKIGAKAIDLDKVMVSGGADDLEHEESWVHNFDTFRIAVKLMGWHANPTRGAGRIVVAVVCEEMQVNEAAKACIGNGRTETTVAAGMDRLREGLFALAVHWRMI